MKKSGSCLFHTSANQVLHTLCYFMAIGMRILKLTRLSAYILRQTDALPLISQLLLKVLIVITCHVSRNVCVCVMNALMCSSVCHLLNVISV